MQHTCSTAGAVLIVCWVFGLLLYCTCTSSVLQFRKGGYLFVSLYLSLYFSHLWYITCMLFIMFVFCRVKLVHDLCLSLSVSLCQSPCLSVSLSIFLSLLFSFFKAKLIFDILCVTPLRNCSTLEVHVQYRSSPKTQHTISTVPAVLQVCCITFKWKNIM